MAYTITWAGKKTTINGLPDHYIRNWDNNIKVKFYHRGKYKMKTNKYGIMVPARNETMIYINKKYFLQLSWNLSKENEATLLQIIKNLYCFGCDLDEIKRLLKAVFYTRN